MAEATHRRPRSRTVLLAILTAVAATMALKAASIVFLPFVLGCFLVAVLWPVYDWLENKVGRGSAAVLTLLCLLGVFSGLLEVLSEAGESLVEGASRYEGSFEGFRRVVTDRAERFGLSIEPLSLETLSTLPLSTMLTSIVHALTGGTLAVAFFTLGLLEVREYGQRIKNHKPERYARARKVAKRVARDFQRYIVVRTFIGLLTGVGVTIVAWAVGLDFPIIWGLVNFLLNYIPTLGSILGVVPPTLFALAQFESLPMAGLVLATVGGVQLVMGNYIDPLLQGRYMQLSPVVVLLAVTFWGWVWGIAGALIAVPLTVFAVLVCREFESTRFIAHILASVEPAETDEGESDVPGAGSHPSATR